MKHTFQKGDRVVGLGAKGVYERPYGDIDDNEHLIRRDDGEAEAHAPFWWFDGVDLQHDRDFHVADWVRYAGTEAATEGLANRCGKIVSIKGKWIEISGFPVVCYNENLVKIAPPTEEKMSEKVTIEHDQWGIVAGVCNANSSAFFKKERGVEMWYNKNDGWREVRSKRWVPVCVAFDGSMRNLKIGSRNNPYEVYFILPEGYRWKTVEIEREGT